MARLTWRDVAAPDYSGSLAGLRTASDLFNKGFTGGQEVIQDIRNRNEENAVRDVLAQAMQANDPEAMNQYIQNADLSRMSLRGLDLLSKQYDTALARQDNREDREWNRYQRGNLREDTELERSLRPELNAASFANNTDDLADLFLSDPRFANINPATLGPIIARARQAQTGDRDFALREQESGLRMQKILGEIGDAATQREVEAAAVELRRGSGGRTTGDVERWINNNPNLSDAAKQSLAKMFGVDNPFTAGPASTSRMPTNINPNAIRWDDNRQSMATSLGNSFSKQNINNPNVIAGILGNIEVENPGYSTAEGDKGSNAKLYRGGASAGHIQWRGPRREAYARRQGVDPTQGTIDQSVDQMMWELFTPEGRKISGISNENVQKIMAAQSPAEAAQLISQHYIRPGIPHMNRRVDAANAAFVRLGGNPSANTEAGLRQQIAQANPALISDAAVIARQTLKRQSANMGRTAQVVDKYAGDTSVTATDAANDLVKSKIAENMGAATEVINTIMQMNPSINPAMAREFAKGAITDTWALFGSGNRAKVNLQGIRTAVDRFTDGSTDKDMVNIQRTNSAAQALVDAQKDAEKASKAAEEATRMRDSGQRPDLDVSSYLQDQLEAINTFQSVLGNSAFTGGMSRQPAAQPVVPAPIAESRGRPSEGRVASATGTSEIPNFWAGPQWIGRQLQRMSPNRQAASKPAPAPPSRTEASPVTNEEWIRALNKKDGFSVVRK